MIRIINDNGLKGISSDDPKEMKEIRDIFRSHERLVRDNMNAMWEFKWKRRASHPPIKDVIFNPPATVVYWGDGEKTVVKAALDDEYDPAMGFMMCVAKKTLGDRYGWFMRNMRKKYEYQMEEKRKKTEHIQQKRKHKKE